MPTQLNISLFPKVGAALRGYTTGYALNRFQAVPPDLIISYRQSEAPPAVDTPLLRLSVPPRYGFQLRRSIHQSLIEHPTNVQLDDHQRLFFNATRRLFYFQREELFYRLPFAEIVHLESHGHYCHLQLTNGETCRFRLGIEELVKLLPPDEFVRTHRCHIVHLRHVLRFDFPHFRVLMDDDRWINISRNRRRGIRKLVERFAPEVP